MVDVGSEIERTKLVKDFWQQATYGLAAETRNIQENFRFYCGGSGQWDEEVIAELDKQGRPHLTINRCKPVVDLLSGYQRKYRDSLELYPRKSGTTQAARVIMQMGRHAIDMARPSGDLVLSEMFMMGVIGGKWWTEQGVDYGFDPVGGDWRTASVSVFNVLEDPLFRGYDVNDNDPYNYCRFIFRNHFLTEDQLRLLYPDKSAIIDIAGSGGDLGSDARFGVERDSGDYEGNSNELLWFPDTANYQGLTRYLVRVCWFKTFKANAYIFNEQTGQVHDFGDKLDQAKSLVNKAPGITAMVRVKPVLHRVDYLGDQELAYEEDPLNGLMEYPLFRFCPYWVDGKPLGEIDNLKDSQREYNKRRSQILHHLNQSANSGWLAEKSSLDSDDVENFRNNGARAGFLGVYNGPNKPERITPTPVSDGHIKLALMAGEDFEDITKLNNAVYGEMSKSGTESGKALETRRDQGLVAKEVCFDNFKYTELGYFSHLVERIRKPDKSGQYIYSIEEIMQLVEENDLAIDVETLRSMELGRYGLKVARSEGQRTVRQENFEQLLNLIKMVGPAAQEIDILDIIDASDLISKDDLIQKIQIRRQQLMMQQQMMADQQMAMAAAGGQPQLQQAG